MRCLKPGGALILALLAVGLVTSSAVALEAENPRFVPPYPKPFHLGSSSQRTTEEGMVPIVFAAKDPETEAAQIILTCRWFKGTGQVTGPTFGSVTTRLSTATLLVLVTSNVHWICCPASRQGCTAPPSASQ